MSDSQPTVESHNNDVQLDESQVIQVRAEKLQALRESGNPFPNDFRPTHYAADLLTAHNATDGDLLKGDCVEVSVAGRIMLQRVMGKASFATVQDMTGRIQIYLKRDAIGEDSYNAFKQWDLGDIAGAKGTLFKTKMGELTIAVTEVRLLTKSLRPLPEKFHGLHDTETRYRQRYLDLICNEASRNTFQIRSKTITAIRQYLESQRFLEVETPMMQPIPGGAIARPFATHHNALDMPFYLRIAPELYLKRLVVGGFERVYEINRNFRNEGMSTQHNPEFTMLEFYQAYADFEDLINLTEDMLRTITEQVLGSHIVEYQGETYDFSQPFLRMTVIEAILHYNDNITEAELHDIDKAKIIANRLGISLKPTYGLGKIQIEIFEKTAEHKLNQPTFITAYPAEVSPLARRNNDDSFVTDRFEFFVAGREIANGFSELNDAEDQAKRFRAQVLEKDAGDDEAMHFDQDYITALEHGMPPTAGEGIGIDRLVMLFTDSPSIRDVLLFPHMRHSG